MLAGLDKEHKEKLHLKEASHYKYLVGGGVTTCEGRDDAEEFAEIRSAMKVLEMSDQDIWEVLKVLASILHMGNLRYKVEEGGEVANIPDQANVERTAHFLGINKQDLLRFAVNSLIIALINYLRALTNKTIFVQGETVTSAISTDQSKDVRDAFAKGIYGRLFVYIVKVNVCDSFNSPLTLIHLESQQSNFQN